jgi:hypothetical protein
MTDLGKWGQANRTAGERARPPVQSFFALDQMNRTEPNRTGTSRHSRLVWVAHVHKLNTNGSVRKHCGSQTHQEPRTTTIINNNMRLASCLLAYIAGRHRVDNKNDDSESESILSYWK